MDDSWKVLERSLKAWRRNNPAFLAAGISYYAVFSVVPALIIAFAIIGRIFNTSETQARLIGDLATVFDPDVAASIQTLLKSAQTTATTATIFGVALLVWTSSHLFSSLRYVLNIVWEVPVKSQGVRQFVINRLQAVLMIMLFCGTLLSFLALDVGLAFMKHHLPQYLPGLFVQVLIQLASYAFYLGVFTVIFATIFKFAPQARVAWRNVWVGAFFTSLMFALTRTVLSLYFSMSVIRSFYGAAGSVIVLLVWVYFSMQIFLFGAEFTHAYSRR